MAFCVSNWPFCCYPSNDDWEPSLGGGCVTEEDPRPLLTQWQLAVGVQGGGATFPALLLL